MASEKEEPDDVRSLAAIMRSLGEFIAGEIDEMERAGTASEQAGAKSIPAQVRTPEPAALNLAYFKSLGIIEQPKFLAAKFTGRNEIKHYSFLWGDPNRVDLETEYFDRNTDLWDDRLGKSARLLTWDHGQDAMFNALEPNPIIGKSVEWGDDEWGRWAVSVLDTDRRYRKFVDSFINEGRLGYSSDTAPQYVLREQRGKGVWLKRWPWLAGALTAAPCEHRMKDEFTPEFIKGLGFSLPDAAEDQELELLELQAKHLKILSNL
jgi:hypothetical protein